MNLSKRLSGYVASGRSLRRGGVRLSSIAAYPLHRRISGRTQIVLTDGTQLVAPATEPLMTLFQEIWVQQCYLPPSWTAGPGAVVVDVGANVGVFSVLAAKRAPEAHIIALEPSSPLRAWLSRNVEANRLQNVTVLPFAMSGSNGHSRLWRRGAGVLNTLYNQDLYGSAFEPGEEVETLSLDGLFSRFGIEACALLKLDCEGAEYEILLEASAASLAAVRSIAGEYHIGLNPHTPEEMEEHLRAHGLLTRVLPLADVESGLFYAWRTG